MRYFSVTEAAAQLGMSVRGLRGRIARGEMAAQRVGPRVWAISEEEIERWRTLGRQSPGPKRQETIMIALAKELARRDATVDGRGFEPGWYRISDHLQAFRAEHPEVQESTPEWREFVRAYGEEYSSYTRNIPSPSVAAPSIQRR